MRADDKPKHIISPMTRAGVQRPLSARRGVSLLSYGLLVGLVAAVAIATVTTTGSETTNMFTRTGGILGASTNGSSSQASPSAPDYPAWSVTLGPCGKSGYQGPSYAECQTAYSGTDFSPGSFDSTDSGHQEFTLPYDGIYRFEVRGAEGGRGQYGGQAGRGAVIIADLARSAGDKLSITVGQVGGSKIGVTNKGGGGGGGSFVMTENETAPLIIAGGGGGGHYKTGLVEVLPGGGTTTVVIGPDAEGQTGISGGDGFASGGTNGQAGTTMATGVDGSWGGCGGGGFFSNATASSVCEGGWSHGNRGGRGQGFATNNAGDGGFGGGGGAQLGGGGGGGYSGGGGGGAQTTIAGGGGGSYIDPAASLVSAQSGSNEGDGAVIITYCGPVGC